MFSVKYKKHHLANWSLAYPLVVSQFGHLVVLIVDNLMVGRLGFNYLAASSFANTLYSVLLLFGVGVASGITPLVGKAVGENNETEIRETYFNGFFINLLLGFLILLFTYLSLLTFSYMKQEPTVIELAKPLFILLGYSMIPYMIFLHGKQFIEGLGDTKPGMRITIVCNVLNILLNFILIYGLFGFPQLFLNGAGYAILIARVFMAVWILIYIYQKKEYKKYVENFRFKFIKYVYCIKIIRIGLPIGIQLILEVGFFTFCGILIGTFGSQALAAYQIVISLSALTFVMASGIGQAAMIRISQFYGQKDIKSIVETGNSSNFMVVIMMCCFGLIFICLRNTIPAFYVKEAAVQQLASQFFVVIAIYQIFDGVQANMIHALRGLQDVKIPTYIALFSFWFFALASTYLFAFHLKIGALGVWYGLLTGLVSASILLTGRFFYRCRQIENDLKI